MIANRLIVCIASAWDYDPTSKHQVAKILADRNEIVWVNYHGSRRPRMRRGDIVGSLTALGRVVRGSRRVSPSITQVTPLVIPGATTAALKRWHEAMLIAQIRRAVRKADRGRGLPVQVWSFAPDVPYLVGKFDEECFLYYCVDEYREFEGFDSARVAEAEDELIDRADVVVATSDSLVAARRRRRPDVKLVRHGVDFDHFVSAWRSDRLVPEDMQSIPGPIFGFFGLIEHWIDCNFLAAVAAARPTYSFVLLGDVKVDVSSLAARFNVHFLGRKPYTALPDYCARFDGALMLFKQNAMTRHVNPVKLREYLAAGLPVVSTPLPEAGRYPSAVRVCASPEAFARACDEVVASGGGGRAREISATVAGETWHARVDDLSRHVMSMLTSRGSIVSKPAAEVVVAPSIRDRALAERDHISTDGYHKSEPRP